MNLVIQFLLTISVVNILSSENSHSKEQLFYDAVRLESSGNIAEAIKKYEKALSEASSANLHGNLANLYYLSDKYGKSILHYRKSLLLEPDNRDFQTNLDYVCKMAKVGNSNNEISQVLKGFPIDSWKGLLAIIFWSGLLIICFMFHRRFSTKSITALSCCWIALNLLFTYLIYQSAKRLDIMERTVVALNPDNVSENNSSTDIQLRKFAAKTSSANSSVRFGETLIVDKSVSGTLQTHQSQGAQNWLLVSTPDKRARGWVLEDEVGWLTRN
ncbi:MAG: tetratricopeptide repeat protein [Verrucomicrobiota bacterium]|nr:tetratricopeptide repeat protein [Verrucomicrobiota bacterium]